MSSNNIHMDDDLLVKYLVGEANAQEKQNVEQWIAASESNKHYYEHFQLIWNSSLTLAGNSSKDENAAWQRLQSRMHKQNTTTDDMPVIEPKNKMHWLRIAASVILISAIALFTYRTYFSHGEGVTQLTVQSHDRTLTDTLPDGSLITLNKNSSIAYSSRFKGNTRAVKLQGEAFFKVTPDKAKPFIITVNDVTVRVVGTSFNVKSRKGKTEVVVETGLVQVKNKGAMVQLAPGEKATAGSGSILSKQKNESSLYNYYRTHELVCNQTPLADLVETLNEAYSADIIISSPSLKRLSITTVFKDQSLDQILEIIEQTFKINIEHQDKRILLR